MIYLKSGIAFRIKGNASSILNSCVALVLSHGNSDFHNCTLHMLPRQFKKCVKAAWNISHCLGKQSAVATASSVNGTTALWLYSIKTNNKWRAFGY